VTLIDTEGHRELDADPEAELSKLLLVPDTEADREVLLLARGLLEAELQAVTVPLTVEHLEPGPLTL
jgi:hypothetical protein